MQPPMLEKPENAEHERVLQTTRPYWAYSIDYHKQLISQGYAGTFQPIRILFDFSLWNDNVGTSSQKVRVQNNLIPSMNDYITKLLKVFPNKATLKSPSVCFNYTIPAAHITTGFTNTDYVTYVTNSNDKTSGFRAWAGACYLSATYGRRPQVGMIHVNLAEINEDSAFTRDLKTMVHEFIHALGFSSGIWGYFISSDGQALYANDTVKTFTENGASVEKVIAAKVIDAAKTYFGCSTINGIALENEGSSGSKGSHWESLANREEVMCAQSRSNTKLTTLTISLLESTGWYFPDYSLAQTSTWGKNKGCDFLSTNCKSTTSFDEFCSSQNAKTRNYCTKDLYCKSICSTEMFTNGCEIYGDNVSNGDCTDVDNSNTDLNKLTFENYGFSSFCHLSDVIKNGYIYSLNSRCYETRCILNNNQYSLEITVISEKIICTESMKGMNITIKNSDLKGGVICPDVRQTCTDIIPLRCINNCYNLGLCLSNQTCFFSETGMKLLGFCSPSYYKNSANQCVLCNNAGEFRRGIDDGNGVCDLCASNCQTCKSSSECSVCSNNFYLTSTSKCDSCSAVGYVKSGKSDGTGTCLTCPSMCASCSPTAECSKCLTYYYLTSAKQCSPCTSTGETPSGPSDGSGTCEKNACSANCQQCTSTSCTKCAPNYYINQAGSCEVCNSNGSFKEGLADGTGSCKICSSNCKTCSSATVCATCLETYFLRDGKCVACTSPGDFQSGSACLSCGSNCLTCGSSSSCSKCISNYYISSGKCVLCNQVGYFKTGASDGSGACDSCSSNCGTCQSLTSCSQCLSQYYIIDSICSVCTGSNQFKSGLSDGTGTCTTCGSTCSSCSGSSTCSGCKSGFYLKDSSVCVACTNPGEFIKGTFCYFCGSNCKTCSSETSCSVCSSGNYLYQGKCDSCSSDGYFKTGLSDGTGTCGTCAARCKTCSTSTDCQACTSGYYLFNGISCLACTEKGQIIVAATCYLCSSNCDTCSNKDSCSKCTPNYYLKGGKCVLCTSGGEQKDGLADGTGVCRNCVSNCFACSGDICTKCNTNLYLLNGQCTDCTQSGYFITGDKSGSGLCQICGTNCNTCESATKCSKCVSGYYIINSNCVLCQSEGEFKQTVAGIDQCFICDMNCKTCQDSNQCSVCKSGFTLSPSNKCINCEEPGTFKNSLGQCIQCVSQCLVCSGETLCDTCIEGFYIRGGTVTKNTCITCNQDGEFINGKLCQVCDPNCKTCASSTACATCKPNFYLLESKCVDCQSPGQFYEGLYCYQCSSNCRICSTKSTCSKCQPTFYLKSGGCDTCVGDGLFKKGDIDGSGLCTTCANNCRLCLAENKCAQCLSNYYLLDGECLLCSDLGQFKKGLNDGSGTCAFCSSNCNTCQNELKCTACKPSYYITSDACSDCSLQGYFKKGLADGTGSCFFCSSNCLECQSESACKTCKSNYYKNYKGQCILCDGNNNVKSGKADGTGECFTCPLKCENCPKNGICVKCMSKYFLTEEADDCVDCKAINQFRSGLEDGTGTCYVCSLNCDICKDAKNCQTCSQNYFLDIKGQCMKCDQGGQYRKIISGNTGICIDCVENCMDCLSPTICYTCKTDFYDFNQGLNCIPCNEKGQMKNGTNDGSGNCYECPKNCIDCADPNSCRTCDSNYYVQFPEQANCVKCNEYGNILVKTTSTDSKCYSCGNNCLECLDKDKCRTCVEGYYLKSGNCSLCNNFKEFPNLDTKNCENCLSGCLNCTTTTTCKVCEEGLFFESKTSSCEKCSIEYCKYCNEGKDTCSECFPGWAIDGGKCQACSVGSPNCLLCEIRNISSCTQCESQFSLVPIENKCVNCTIQNCKMCIKPNKCSICEEGFLPSVDGTCTQCSANCIECQTPGEKGFCKTCKTTYANFKGACVKNCRVDNCRSCLDDTLQCQQCNTGFFLKENTCLRCPVDCEKCSNSTYCVDCAPNYYILNNNSIASCSKCLMPYCDICFSNGYCGKCYDGYFFNTSSRNCSLCTVKNCFTCNNQGKCNKCLKNYTLNNDGDCIPCPIQNCVACSSPNTCSRCNPGFQTDLTSTECLSCGLHCNTCNQNLDCSQCINGYFVNERPGGSVCTPCEPNCAQCTSFVDCQNCLQGWVLSQGFCYSCKVSNCLECNPSENCIKCLPNYEIINDACLKIDCHASCQTCKGRNDTDCLTCNKGYYQSKISDNSVKCLACGQKCETCQTANTCTSCRNPEEFQLLGVCTSRNVSNLETFKAIAVDSNLTAINTVVGSISDFLNINLTAFNCEKINSSCLNGGYCDQGKCVCISGKFEGADCRFSSEVLSTIRDKNNKVVNILSDMASKNQSTPDQILGLAVSITAFKEGCDQNCVKNILNLGDTLTNQIDLLKSESPSSLLVYLKNAIAASIYNEELYNVSWWNSKNLMETVAKVRELENKVTESSLRSLDTGSNFTVDTEDITITLAKTNLFGGDLDKLIKTNKSTVLLSEEAKIMLMALNDGNDECPMKLSAWKGTITPYYSLASQGKKAVIKSAAANISFYNMESGRHLQVENLEKKNAIKIQLRSVSGYGGSDQCMVWSEENSNWNSQNEVSRANDQSVLGYTTCETVHLSTFTVIVKDVAPDNKSISDNLKSNYGFIAYIVLVAIGLLTFTIGIISARKATAKNSSIDHQYKPPSNQNNESMIPPEQQINLPSNLRNPIPVGLNQSSNIVPGASQSQNLKVKNIRWIQMVPIPGICINSGFRVGIQKLSIWLINIGMIMTVQAIVLSVYFAKSGDEIWENGYFLLFMLLSVSASWILNYFYGCFAVCLRDEKNKEVDRAYWVLFVISYFGLGAIVSWRMWDVDEAYSKAFIVGFSIGAVVDLIIDGLLAFLFTKTGLNLFACVIKYRGFLE